jgi:hypothetical protein
MHIHICICTRVCVYIYIYEYIYADPRELILCAAMQVLILLYQSSIKAVLRLYHVTALFASHLSGSLSAILRLY